MGYFSYIVNGSFEYGNPPLNWTLSGAGASVSQSAGGYFGGYCAALTRAGADTRLAQPLPPYPSTPTFFRGKQVTFGCWVKTSTASQAKLLIIDGVGNSQSSFHTGGGDWEWLTVTRTIDAAATEVTPICYIPSVNGTAYFDGAIFIVGASIPTSIVFSVGEAFGSNIQATNPIWTDISDDVREIHPSRGRSHEMDRMESGVCDIVLNNESGDYWPDNTSSDYTPNVDVMKKIQVQAYYNQLHYVFTGYIESYEPSYLGEGGYGSLMTLHCVGKIGKVLSLQVLNASSGYNAESSGVRVENVLSACQVASADYIVDGGEMVMASTGALTNANALDHLYKVQESELSLLYESPDGHLVYESRGHRAQGAHVSSQATFGTGSAEVGYTDFTYVKDDVLLFNDVRITRTGGTEQVVTSSTSQAKYGRRSYVKSGTLNNSDEDAYLNALFISTRYGNSAGRVETVEITPDSSAKWSQCLSREISDRITFKNEGAGINNDFFVESIEHDWNFVDTTYKTSFSLSNASTYLAPLSPISYTLRPNAAGQYTNLQGTPTGTAHWDLVNEQVESSADYVWTTSASAKDTYKINFPYNSGDIASTGIMVFAKCKEIGLGGQGSIVIRTHSTDYIDTTDTLSSSYDAISQAYTTNPFTSASWTVAEVKDLQIGIHLNGGPGYNAECDQIYASLTFTPTWAS